MDLLWQDSVILNQINDSFKLHMDGLDPRLSTRHYVVCIWFFLVCGYCTSEHPAKTAKSNLEAELICKSTLHKSCLQGWLCLLCFQALVELVTSSFDFMFMDGTGTLCNPSFSFLQSADLIPKQSGANQLLDAPQTSISSAEGQTCNVWQLGRSQESPFSTC